MNTMSQQVTKLAGKKSQKIGQSINGKLSPGQRSTL